MTSLCKGRDGYNTDVGDRPPQPLVEIVTSTPVTTTTTLLASSPNGKNGGRGRRRRSAAASNELTGGTAQDPASPIIRELRGRGRDVLRLLREKDLAAAVDEITAMIGSIKNLDERLKDDSEGKEKSTALGARAAARAYSGSESVHEAASAIVDEAIQAISQRAFAPPYRGGDVQERIRLGLDTLQLQVSPSSKLASPYDTVPRSTWVNALRALTGVRANDFASKQRTRGTCISSPPDASYRVLQRLISGFGVRPPAKQEKTYPIRSSSTLDERDFSMVLNAFARSGRMNMAHRIVALQERTEFAPPLSPVAYSIMIKGYGDLGDADNVEMILSRATNNGITPDTIMYNSLIDAYVNCDLVDKAFAAFSSVTDRNGGDMTSIPTPNIRTYNTMLKGFAKRGDLKKALELSRTMDAAGLWNDVTTNTLVKVAVNAHEFSAAEDILTKFTATEANGRQGEERGKNGKKWRQHPNIEGYTALLDGYGKARMLDKALATLQLMRKRGVEPNEYTYTCLISAMARAHKVDQAKKMLDYMESTGIKPTSVTYNAFMAAMLADAPTTQSLSYDGFVSEEHSLYNERVVIALGIFGRMKKSKVRPNTITVSTIVDGLGKCSPPRIAEAKLIVAKLEQDGTISSKEKRVGTALIQACGNGDDFQGALDAFENIGTPDIIALNAFLDSCCKCGAVKTALGTFERFVDSSRALSPKSRYLRPDIITYTVLISALLKMNTVSSSNRARLLYGEMQSKWGIIPDKALIDIILTAMVGGGSLGLDSKDVKFTFSVLRDAESLEWEPGQYERRMRTIRGVFVGRMSEVWKEDEASYGMESPVRNEDPLFKKKGWNKVDSGFRLWGGGFDKRLEKRSQNGEDSVDEFLEAHGWNDVDSGFRLF